ncbi:hypothetical protein GCM10009733_023990 [Nonomuraea maheshkhaliensis]|uniref:Uncharacterized protein n=1 Tax=Nonomuraea maheshkhaliensis TaxID=419590 RepID=A0ABP4R284_9ACTN
MESGPDFRLPFPPPKVVADTHRLPQGRPSGRDTMALLKQNDWNGTEIPFTGNHSANARRG